MMKKILAIVLSVIMCFSITIPAFALDLGGIIGGGSTEDGSDDESGEVSSSDILSAILNSDIFNQIISSEGVVDITGIVMEIAMKIMSGQIKEDGKQLAAGVLQSTVDSIAEIIMQMYENKDLVIVYDKKVIERLFDVNLGNGNEDDEEEENGPDDLQIGPGDVDGDGKLTGADARLILRRAARLIKFTDEQDMLADVDKDGSVTANDARIVLRVVAGLETLDA